MLTLFSFFSTNSESISLIRERDFLPGFGIETCDWGCVGDGVIKKLGVLLVDSLTQGWKPDFFDIF